VYVIGEPGVGKSTLVRRALAPELDHFGRDGARFAVWAGYVDGASVAYLGDPRHERFPGTDRLSMSVAPHVTDWLTAVVPLNRYDTIVGEGDRLSTIGLFRHAASLGLHVHVIHATSTAAAERRKLRSDGGPEQSPAWVAGRVTKVANLAAAVKATEGLLYVGLDLDQDAELCARALRRVIVGGRP
jgi:hypothetical protein